MNTLRPVIMGTITLTIAGIIIDGIYGGDGPPFSVFLVLGAVFVVGGISLAVHRLLGD